jgi:uncharacterized protein YpmB
MNIFHNKKSEALIIILIVIIVVVFLGWIVSIGSKECRSNSDCSSEFYCGSDFACHKIPTIEKTIVKNNLIFPSTIIGIAIIIAAIIIKWSKLPFRKRIKPKENEEPPNNIPKSP